MTDNSCPICQNFSMFGYVCPRCAEKERKRALPAEDRITEINTMNKTALVYTQEEALAIEPSKRPMCYRVPSKIYHDAFLYVGQGSMSWEPRPTGVFSPELATEAVINLLFSIAEELEKAGLHYENWPPEWKGDIPRNPPFPEVIPETPDPLVNETDKANAGVLTEDGLIGTWRIPAPEEIIAKDWTCQIGEGRWYIVPQNWVGDKAGDVAIDMSNFRVPLS